jgi:hypothetical protein
MNELSRELYIIATTKFSAHSDEAEVLTKAGNTIMYLESQNEILERRLKMIVNIAKGG